LFVFRIQFPAFCPVADVGGRLVCRPCKFPDMHSAIRSSDNNGPAFHFGRQSYVCIQCVYSEHSTASTICMDTTWGQLFLLQMKIFSVRSKYVERVDRFTYLTQTNISQRSFLNNYYRHHYLSPT